MKALFKSFEKLKQGLAKTKNSIVEKIQSLIQNNSTLDEALIENIREVLYQSDVGFEITESIAKKIESRLKNEKSDEIVNIVKEELYNILTNVNVKSSGIDFNQFKIIDQSRPKIIIVVGVNGTGKTTSIGKIAYNFKLNDYKVLIAAADTFRAAANEQLSIWAKRAEVEIIDNPNTKDPGAVVYEAIDKAIKNQIDIVLVDTAGRLHTKTDLMNELNKITRVVEKRLNNKPDEVLLVIDATTGQNAVVQIDNFLKYAPLTGIILTKLDGTAKGGVIFQIIQKFNIPVKFIGVGEGIDDLQPFDANDFINALFEN